MKRTQIINIICSLLLASLLIISVVLIAIFSSDGGRLVIASVSTQKEYDGTPLTAQFYEIISGELKSGHSIRASFFGSQTEIGASENAFSVAVVDESGNDVTDSYEIELVFGKLNVIPERADGGGIGIGSGSVGGGSTVDLGGRISRGSGVGGNSLCLRVKNEISDTVYLKIKSFGAYTGTAWQDAVEYDGLIDGGLSASYLSSFAINKEDSLIEIKSFTDQYFLPYYMSHTDFENCEKQISDVMYHGDTEESYSVRYGKFDYEKAASLPSTFRTYEKNYRTFLDSQYLEIDDETREYMESIIRARGFYRNDLETVLKVAEYIQSCAKYSLNYNEELDYEENIAVAFLDEYREGICQHYASAATLLYRAMGLPARYTVGFVVNTEAGEWVDVKGRSAHAWVEVYIKNMGWVQIEVTNGFQSSNSSGALEYSASITPVVTEKQYDGTPLYAENKVSGFEKYEAMGFTYAALINGSRTELGKTSSVIESFTVYDRYGKDVTNEFGLTFNEGTVHVYLSELVFESEGETKEFDGYAIYTNISTCKMISGELRGGDVFTVLSHTYLVNASTVNADFDVIVINSDGLDVTDIYKITKNCGLLTITPRKLTVKAGDATKIYDHSGLSEHSYYITEGTLADGNFISYCKIEGVQVEVGRSDNIIKNIVILNKFGVDVTSNYAIKLEKGILQVRPSTEKT